MTGDISTVPAVATEATLQPRISFTGDLWQRWLDFVDVKPATVATYARAMRSFFGYLSEHGIQHPQRADVLAYRDDLKSRLKATTVQTYMVAVRLFFRWTAQAGIYPNVADHVKGAKVQPGHKKDYLTSGQAAAVLDGIDRSTLTGLRDYAMVALMLTTGLRTVSVIHANVGDLGTVGDCAVLYYQGKGRDDKAEFVKLAEPVDTAIRAYMKARGSVSDSDPLFASAAHGNRGGRMATRSVSRIAKEAMRAAGYDSDRLTAHSMRHTAATLSLINGATLEETQHLLGHRNINTTMIYSHALEAAENTAAGRVAAAIF